MAFFYRLFLVIIFFLTALNVSGQNNIEVRILETDVNNVIFKELLKGIIERDRIRNKNYDYYFISFHGNTETTKMSISGTYFDISAELKRMSNIITFKVDNKSFIMHELPVFLNPLFKKIHKNKYSLLQVQSAEDSDLQLPLDYMGELVYEIKSDLSFVLNKRYE